MKDPRIIVAIDAPSLDEALRLAARLKPELCRLKVGKELFTACGPAIIEKLMALGFQVFLDLKFHDIPNTVAGACAAAASLGVWMLNVHASGGPRMLDAAREAVDKSAQRPLLIAVTVLTSLQQEDLFQLGFVEEPQALVFRLAGLAREAGFDGVVCSAHEAAPMKERFGRDFRLVTPGIRLAGDAMGDQRRVMTPQEAVQAGSDYVVIGRSITASDDPLSRLLTINSDLAAIPLRSRIG
ncbi:MAG TPA: orotidine-5'-phosphate decarboxylase [Gammaproteobacteria bacterium]|nr:orotidine-5'-phosphate decarboxylase [Gammaproteobacteria bacterium]